MSRKKNRGGLAKQGANQAPIIPKSVQQRQLRSFRMEQLSTRVTFGPIPSADEFLRYQQVQADFPERIMRQYERRMEMAEVQSSHRMKLESHVVRSNTIMERLGWASATSFGWLVLGGSLWLLHEGKSLAGIAGIVTALATLLGLYVWSRRDQMQAITKKRAADLLKAGATPEQLELLPETENP